MGVSIDEVRLGTFRGVRFDRGGNAWAIVLPGAGYSVQAPLLWYAREAAMAAGRNVLAVTETYDRATQEPLRWVLERAEAALAHLRVQDEHPLVVAKSLTSLAASLAADANLPAVWLTPLIAGSGSSVAAEVLRGLRASTAPMMLIGGSADPTWDGFVARSVSDADVIELPEADHSLQVSGEPDRSLANLIAVTGAIRFFVERLDRG